MKNVFDLKENIYEGFEPFYDENSRVLILGSFPSVKSRQVAFYYGNGQNRFWKILSEFFGETADSLEQKKILLKANGIALWDVVVKCEIVGSMDSAIKNYVVADVPRLLSAAPKIGKILVNGQTAFRIFSKNFPELKDRAVCLPSTSPANVKFDKTAWFKALEK